MGLPGPMGSVLTPLMTSLDEAGYLPNACTMNGHCQTVCPMSIPLPSLLRRLRFRQFDHGLVKWSVNALLGVWGYVAKRPSFITPYLVRVFGLCRWCHSTWPI